MSRQQPVSTNEQLGGSRQPESDMDLHDDQSELAKIVKHLRLGNNTEESPPRSDQDASPARKNREDRQGGLRGFKQKLEARFPAVANVTHIGPPADPYSEAVANRNVSHDPDANKTISESGRREPMKQTDAHQPIPIPEDARFKLGRSEDVEEHVSHAPAVTHETRIVNTHEIVEEQITRDIHNHHIFHRVLPIDDVEVLPPRHFVPSNSSKGCTEIQPPKASRGLQGRVRDAFSSHMTEKRAQDRASKTKDVFDQGDQHQEWVASNGVACSESMWVHSPQLATAARDAGETVPFHFNHEDEPKQEKTR